MIYPFTPCLHPRQIQNKYTGEMMIVGCGQCEACLTRKAGISSLQCKLESMSHRYSYFVTLTFDNFYIPKAVAVNNGDGTFSLVDAVLNHTEQHPFPSGEVYCTVKSTELDMSAIARKVNLGGLFPVLTKRPLQLFLKRLRKLFKDEGFRYYACGEYGPVHFRPHYHIELWFEKPYNAAMLEMYIRQSWKFGRIDVQRAKDKAAAYIAGYLNSHGNLPKVFKSGKCKSFSTHSFFLGQQVLSRSVEEVYKTPSREFNKRSVFISQTYTEFNLWRSFKSYFYPRCLSFSLLPSDVRFQSYRAFLVAKSFGHQDSCFKLAKTIVNYLYDSSLNYRSDSSKLHKNPVYDSFLRLLVSICRLDLYKSIDTSLIDFLSKDYLSAVRSVYMYLSISKHFLDFCCQGDYSQKKSREVLTIIEKYYKDSDYDNLVSFYDDLEQVTDLDFYSKESNFLYNNMFFNEKFLYDSVLYKRFKSLSINSFNNSMKHKLLNDKNAIFNNK